jgi:hypothetical protein
MEIGEMEKDLRIVQGISGAKPDGASNNLLDSIVGLSNVDLTTQKAGDDRGNP